MRRVLRELGHEVRLFKQASTCVIYDFINSFGPRSASGLNLERRYRDEAVQIHALLHRRLVVAAFLFYFEMPPPRPPF